MKNLKKMVSMLPGLCALFAVNVNSSEAAYALNPEVTTATTALKNASQIGVMVNENKALANKANKDAIVVMSFGTTYKENRDKTITQTVPLTFRQLILV